MFKSASVVGLTLRESFPSRGEEILGENPRLLEVLRQVEIVSSTDSTVLLLGETGTGKGLLASMIHAQSRRRGDPFMVVSCAAVPFGLLESELFGYERGAFTGAVAQRIGRFEAAHGGTIFLDEIGDIPPELQPKLLRVLQDHKLERLGSTRTMRIDVRLIAATHRNLRKMIADGTFRSDLYYRLNVFPITVPPLRERCDDIPLLVRHFVTLFAKQMDKTIKEIPRPLLTALCNHSWPGNIRELEHFIERAVILSQGPVLEAPLSELSFGDNEEAEPVTLKEAERAHIRRTLHRTDGVIAAAAQRLGVPRSTLFYMMRRLGITTPRAAPTISQGERG